MKLSDYVKSKSSDSASTDKGSGELPEDIADGGADDAEENDEGGKLADEFGVSPDCMARLVKYIVSNMSGE